MIYYIKFCDVKYYIVQTHCTTSLYTIIFRPTWGCFLERGNRSPFSAGEKADGFARGKSWENHPKN